MAKSKKTKKNTTIKDKNLIITDQTTTRAYITEDNIKSIIRLDNKTDITLYYVRTWIDSKKIPYKYEFKGQYSAYHNPEQLDIKHNNQIAAISQHLTKL